MSVSISEDMHAKAVGIEQKPSITKIYGSTPLVRALAMASTEEKRCVCKLFDIPYMLAKEEIPLSLRKARSIPWQCLCHRAQV